MTSASLMNLLPMIIVALGAMVCIATEPFIADKNKGAIEKGTFSIRRISNP